MDDSLRRLEQHAREAFDWGIEDKVVGLDSMRCPWSPNWVENGQLDV